MQIFKNHSRSVEGRQKRKKTQSWKGKLIKDKSKADFFEILIHNEINANHTGNARVSILFHTRQHGAKRFSHGRVCSEGWPPDLQLPRVSPLLGELGHPGGSCSFTAAPFTPGRKACSDCQAPCSMRDGFEGRGTICSEVLIWYERAQHNLWLSFKRSWAPMASISFL